MPRTLTIFLPNGRTEYWLTHLVFKPGDKLQGDGTSWIVTRVGRFEAYEGGTRHMTVTVRADGTNPGDDHASNRAH